MSSQQVWVTNSLGGYYSNNQLSKEIRHASQPLFRFRTFTQPMRETGKGKGDTVYYNKISNIASQGGTLVETEPMAKSAYTIQRGSLVVTEYGNALAMTEKLKSLSDTNVSQDLRTVLMNDQAKVLDSAAAAQFQLSKIKAVIKDTATTTITTDGVAGSNAGGNMSDKNVRDIVDYMKKLNIPRFGNTGEYVSIASVNSLRGLYDHFEAKTVNTTMMNAIKGYIGSYYGTAFNEETNVLSNALQTNYGEAVFFGNDAVREGIVVDAEVRLEIPKDFGRDQAIAWYYLGGFQKVWDYAVDSEERIIHVTSL